MGGTQTDGRYAFNSSTEIVFKTPFAETCTFKMLNEKSFFPSDCGKSFRDGIYRYKRARR